MSGLDGTYSFMAGKESFLETLAFGMDGRIPCTQYRIIEISHLRIDNSRRGALHVLWNFSRTKIATTLCDTSNERAYFSACVDANGIVIHLELKKRPI